MRTKTIVHRSLSILLGTVFILSAITKAFSLKAFGGEVMLYLEIYFNGWLSDYSIHVAALICLAELTQVFSTFCLSSVDMPTWQALQHCRFSFT